MLTNIINNWQIQKYLLIFKFVIDLNSKYCYENGYKFIITKQNYIYISCYFQYPSIQISFKKPNTIYLRSGNMQYREYIRKDGTEWRATRHSYICSNHFERWDYGLLPSSRGACRLKNNAVPSVFQLFTPPQSYGMTEIWCLCHTWSMPHVETCPEYSSKPFILYWQ